MIIKKITLLLSFIIIISVLVSAEPNIDPKLIKELNSQDSTKAIVMLKDDNSLVQNFRAKPYPEYTIYNEKTQQKIDKQKSMVSQVQEKVLSKLNIEKINGDNKYYKPSQEIDFKLVYRLRVTNGFVGEITNQGLEKLRLDENVISIYANEEHEQQLSQTVPLVKADRAHNFTAYQNKYDFNLTGKHQAVCVLDSGVDATHPDLGGCALEQIRNHQCDKVPVNYNTSGSFYGIPWEESIADIDWDGHGTNIAGVIAADGKLKGIAPDAKIINVQVCTPSCNSADEHVGIDWCINNKVNYNISIMSWSLGGGYETEPCDIKYPTSAFKTQIDLATKLSMMFIAASGNYYEIDGIIGPACLENATSVGWTDIGDTMSSQGNRAWFLDMVAPGCVNTTTPQTCTIPGSCDPSGYAEVCGTSFSTPHVAGAAALIYEFYEKQGLPPPDPLEVRDLLKRTGRPVWDYSVLSSARSNLTYKRLDIYAALMDLNQTAVNQSIDLKKGWNLITTSVMPLYYIKSIGNILWKDYRYDKIYNATMWNYNNNNWYLYHPPSSSYSFLYWNNNIAFWLNSTKDQTINIYGYYDYEPVEFNLNQGWNMIGYPHNESQSADDVFANLNNYNAVYAYDAKNSKWLSYVPGWGSDNTLTTLEPGMGMWIKSDIEQTALFKDGGFES